MGDPLTFLEHNCRAWDYLRNWLALRAPSESAIDFSSLAQATRQSSLTRLAS